MENKNQIKLQKEGIKNNNSKDFLFFMLVVFSIIISFSFIDNREKISSKPIHVLIVTGMDISAHDWQKTSKVLKKQLKNSKEANIKVEILKDPYRLESVELGLYDVILLNFNNWEKPDPSSKAEENLRQFVAKGGGLVLIHFASGAFRDWTEFPKLAGKVWDRENTHDPRGLFRVEIKNDYHPITKGMQSYETDDELYIGLEGDKQVEILAEARSIVTDKYHPMAFVHSYENGRIFHTTLGHDGRAIQIPGTSQLIRNAVIWVAKRTAP